MLIEVQRLGKGLDMMIPLQKVVAMRPRASSCMYHLRHFFDHYSPEQCAYIWSRGNIGSLNVLSDG